MPKIIQERPPVIEMSRYSDSQLIALETQLEKYLVTKSIRYPRSREVKIYDIDKFLIDQGALSKKGAVILDREHPPLYTMLTDKLRQLNDFKARRKGGGLRQLEDYQELANGMHITSSQEEES